MTRVQTETGRSTKILLRSPGILKQVNKEQVQRHMIAIIGEYGLWSKRQANSINICISVLFCHGKISTKKLSIQKCQAPQLSVITLTISTGSKKLTKKFPRFVRFCVSVEQNMRNSKQYSLKFMIIS